ncbi:MAG: ketoacyl-ACP synthase III [Desulfobacterales bacterium]|nr:MAG: ketoacyl-ACP synthase III [Desulfobacterales bacterium]
MPNSIITKVESYIPELRVTNAHFLNHEFYGSDGKKLEKSTHDIIKKFEEITGIKERRYVTDELNTTDLAFITAERILATVDKETLDYIIVAQNFGDVETDNIRSDMVPTIAARVKHRLKIKNPYTIASDIPFGCPGWLHGIILADYYIKSGDAKRVLVIGVEILSRVLDPHDVDSMIFADGAGAALIEATDQDAGILSHITRSDTLNDAYLLRLGRSYNSDHHGDELFIKMHGHEIYKYVVRTVPKVIKQSLDKVGYTLTDVNKIFTHQANQKMNQAILDRLLKLYKLQDVPDHVMPMTISWLGNTSVASIPTLYDLFQRGKLNHPNLHSKDIIVFASVGAGMNVNSVVYRVP